jgi:hypothetical protein
MATQPRRRAPRCWSLSGLLGSGFALMGGMLIYRSMRLDTGSAFESRPGSILAGVSDGAVGDQPSAAAVRQSSWLQAVDGPRSEPPLAPAGGVSNDEEKKEEEGGPGPEESGSRARRHHVVVVATRPGQWHRDSNALQSDERPAPHIYRWCFAHTATWSRRC